MQVDEAKDFLRRHHDRPGEVFKELMSRDGLVVALGVSSALDTLAARAAKEDLEQGGASCTFRPSTVAGGPRPLPVATPTWGS